MRRIACVFSLFALLSLLACTDNPAPETEVVSAQVSSESPEARLEAMGITLPEVSPPQANYVNTVRSGNLVFVAGKGPRKADGTMMQGKLGDDLTVEQGYEAAKLTAIESLAALKAELGDLSKVTRLVKVHGMVNSAPDFGDQSKVMNGYSDFMVEVFGEKGKHARAAVGMAALPGNIAVEVELIAEVE